MTKGEGYGRQRLGQKESRAGVQTVNWLKTTGSAEVCDCKLGKTIRARTDKRLCGAKKWKGGGESKPTSWGPHPKGGGQHPGLEQKHPPRGKWCTDENWVGPKGRGR